MTTYTILVKTAAELAAINGLEDGLFAELAEMEFTGFTIVPPGSMFSGGYQGVINGEEVIFIADEVALAVPE